MHVLELQPDGCWCNKSSVSITIVLCVPHMVFMKYVFELQPDGCWCNKSSVSITIVLCVPHMVYDCRGNNKLMLILQSIIHNNNYEHKNSKFSQLNCQLSPSIHQMYGHPVQM